MTVQSKLGYWFLDFTIEAGGMFDNSYFGQFF